MGPNSKEKTAKVENFKYCIPCPRGLLVEIEIERLVLVLGWASFFFFAAFLFLAPDGMIGCLGVR